MLELAPGDAHHWILLIGTLGGGKDVGGHELAAPGGGREVRLEHHRLSRIAFVLAGIGDRRVALEPLPGDAADRVHRLAHLVPYLFGSWVAPSKTQPLRQLDDDPEILARFARRLQRAPPELHHA